LGLGNGSVHRRSRNGAWESWTDNEYLDQVPRHRYSWKYDNLDGIRRRVRNSGAKAWIFDGIPGSRTQVIPKSDLLASSTRHPNPLSVERFRMEIVSLSDERVLVLLLTDSFSSKRMYYPQTYHHIQEIQKYNIQDYRPRYVMLPVPSPF